jgi:hypothetical protein
VCQLRAGFVKDEDEREALWEQQHEIGAQKMYSLCSELGGLFLKVPYFAPFFLVHAEFASLLNFFVSLKEATIRASPLCYYYVALDFFVDKCDTGL